MGWDDLTRDVWIFYGPCNLASDLEQRGIQVHRTVSHIRQRNTHRAAVPRSTAARFHNEFCTEPRVHASSRSPTHCG